MPARVPARERYKLSVVLWGGISVKSAEGFLQLFFLTYCITQIHLALRLPVEVTRGEQKINRILCHRATHDTAPIRGLLLSYRQARSEASEAERPRLPAERPPRGPRSERDRAILERQASRRRSRGGTMC